MTEQNPSLTRGHKKKARTRKRLLDAGVRTFAEQGKGLTVQEVADASDVSTGTFYNYFDNIEAFIDEVAVHTVTSIGDAVAQGAEDDPARRAASATLRLLTMLEAQPAFARVVQQLAVRTDLDDVVAFHLRADLRDGHEKGRFAHAPEGVQETLVFGMVLVAVRRICAGQWGPDQSKTTVIAMLEFLGIGDEESAVIVDEVLEQMAAKADAAQTEGPQTGQKAP